MTARTCAAFGGLPVARRRRRFRPVVRRRRGAARRGLVPRLPRRSDGDAPQPRAPRVRPDGPRDVSRVGAGVRAGGERGDAARRRRPTRRGGGRDRARVPQARPGRRQSRGPRRTAHPAAPPHAARVRLHHLGPAGHRRGGRRNPEPRTAGGSRFGRVRHGGGQPEHVAPARPVLSGRGGSRPRHGSRRGPAAAGRTAT